MTLVALLAVVAGLVGRAVTHSEAAFLVLSMLALGGMAMANVLLPSLVKLHFPDRIGTVTAIYTTALAIGLTAALVLTVPISDAYGGWRVGLGAWAVLALVAALPWLGLVGHDRRWRRSPASSGSATSPAPGSAWRWRCFFGLQSHAGLRHLRLVRPALAGQRLLAPGRPAPWSVAWPRCRSRCRCGRPRRWPGASDQRRILLAVMLCYPVGYVGLMVAPHDLAILWAVLVGVGAGDLPDRADPDRAALAHAGGHRRAVRLHPVDGLPARRDRPVRGRHAPRPHRRLDRAAGAADGAGGAAVWLGLYVARPAYVEDQLPARGSRTMSDVAGSKPPRA